MFKKVIKFLAVSLLVIGTFGTAQAALQTHGPISDLHGYPVWYEDLGGLRLDLCLENDAFCFVDPPIAGNAFSEAIGIGGEAFYWLAETSIDEAGVVAQLGLALESTWVEDLTVDPPALLVAPGNQIILNRIRIRVNVPVTGTYTVTHPFGTATYDIPALTDGGEINETQDVTCEVFPGTLACDFTIPLGDGPNPPVDGARVNLDGISIGPFLTSVGGNVPDPVSGNTYLANPALPSQVTGSPLGTNFFRIQGPGGIDVQTDEFILLGQVSGCDDTSLPPVANADFAAVLGGPAIINVAANDTDNLAIEPRTVVITVHPEKGDVVANLDGTVTYTPDAGASGIDTFTYSIQNRCGLTGVALVTVLIEPAETLAASKAEYRAATGKWSIQGTSTLHEPLARLSGAEEVPPVANTASGYAQVNINQAADAINYALMIDRAADTIFTASHIHVGAAGSNGPPIFFLCGGTAPACPTATGMVVGSLTEANLVPQAAQGINTFADALAAIRSGNAYVNVHTTGRPGGEIRGQLGNFVTLQAVADGPLVGSAVVQPGAPKIWKFEGKSKAAPGIEPRTIAGESTQGRTATIPLRLR